MTVVNTPTPNHSIDQWEAKFAELAKRSQLHRLPNGARDTLADQFKQYKQARRGGIIKHFVASLSFDSAVTPLLAGARNAVSAENRQFVYTTDFGDVALDLSGTGEQLTVSGQLFLDDADGNLLIQLVQNDTEIAQATADELGEFQLDAIPAGIYDVIASSDAFDVELQQVPLTL